MPSNPKGPFSMNEPSPKDRFRMGQPGDMTETFCPTCGNRLAKNAMSITVWILLGIMVVLLCFPQIIDSVTDDLAGWGDREKQAYQEELEFNRRQLVFWLNLQAERGGPSR
jgi:hypothetical protein